MKLVRKLFFYLIIAITITTSVLVIAVILYKEEIIILLKEEINKKIKTKLEVNKIDLKLVKGFPNISVDFQGVKLYEKANICHKKYFCKIISSVCVLKNLCYICSPVTQRGLKTSHFNIHF